jgi:hypothetical protein
VTREDLLAAALKLPLDERAALADRLLRSLDELPEPERKKLWLEVAERRLAAEAVGDNTFAPLTPGVRKFRSIEEMSRQRDRNAR